MIYHIADWEERYENSDTRKRKSLFWVLVPNSHDGLGFCSIMGREDALEIFGAWVLILQCASKCSRRGVLCSTKGRPYTAKDIATITRAPAESIALALDVLVEIGWIHADKSARHSDKVADDSDKVADDSDKVARHSDKVADDPNVSADAAGGRGTKKERKKERKISPLTPQGGENGGGESGIEIPSPLSEDAQFVQTWDRWCKYQTQRNRRGWCEVMQEEQLAHLSTMSPTDAATSLVSAMLKGWQGPAELNHRAKGKEDAAPPARATIEPDAAASAIAEIEEAMR
jgi:hypothetical protein